MIGVLALVVPLGFAAAIAGRDDETDPAALPASIADERAGPRDATRDERERTRGSRLRARPRRGSPTRERVPIGGEPAPSVFVYWSAGHANDELPQRRAAARRAR
jgi:hypothetical protein